MKKKKDFPTYRPYPVFCMLVETLLFLFYTGVYVPVLVYNLSSLFENILPKYSVISIAANL